MLGFYGLKLVVSLYEAASVIGYILGLVEIERSSVEVKYLAGNIQLNLSFSMHNRASTIFASIITSKF